MNKNNLLSGRDKELQELAEQYEAARAENKSIYLDADDLADLADWYAMHRKDDMATEVAEYGLRIHPGNTALLVEQAYLFLDTQQREKAKEIAKQITEEAPEVKVLKASILLDEGRSAEADALVESIEEKEELANIVDVAYMYIDMGFPEKAMKWLKGGQEIYAENEAFLAVSGDCHFAFSEFDKAAVFYNKLIDRNPYSAPYWFGLARCYFNKMMFDKAIEACDYALVADDDFADAYLMKGQCFYQLGNEESALENYMRADQYHIVAPGFINAFIGLSKVGTGEWEEAYDYLKKAISANEESAAAGFTLAALYGNAALCLHRMGKTEKAHQYCQRAYEMDSKEVTPYLIEGRIYFEEGDFKKGILRWGFALNCDPSPETWSEIGMNSMELNLLSYAKTAFERIKQLDPNFENLNERLTVLYLLLKDKPKFMEYNQRCHHPFSQEEADRLYQLTVEEKQEELSIILKNIFDTLQ